MKENTMPATASATLHSVLDQASDDATLLIELSADPLRTLYRLGVRIDGQLLKRLLGIEGATDTELLQVLKARVAPFEPGDCSCSG
jgi:hypothetical protein